MPISSLFGFGSSNRIRATVISVTDGDTVKVRLVDRQVPDPRTGKPTDTLDIRLAGCDAPETAHPGSDKYDQPFGTLSRDRLQQKLSGEIELELGNITYDRYAATVTVNGENVADWMIQNGYAWAPEPPHGTARQRQLQAEAQSAKRGIWDPALEADFGKPQQPWEYRRTKGASFSSTVKVIAKDNVTGNDISSQIKVYGDGKTGNPLTLRHTAGILTESNGARPSSFIEEHELTISAKGYETQKLTVKMGQAEQTVNVTLVRSGTQTDTVLFKFSPSVDVSCTLTAEGYTKAFTANGGSASVDGLILDKAYTLSYSHELYQSGSQTITPGISCPRPVEIVLQEKPGSASSKDQPTAPDNSQAGLNPINPPSYPEDFQGVGTDDFGASPESVSYYTAAQAKLYIGNLWIDQMQAMQFVANENTIPIYPYCDKFPAAYAEGRSLVQGQIVLNYVSDWYLLTALKNYQQLLGEASALSPEEQQTYRKLIALMRKPAALLQTHEQRQLNDILSSENNRNIIAAANLFAKRLQTRSENNYDNAIYKRILFDMILEFGDGPSRSLRRFERCKLISNEQVLDQSGQVQAEIYGFVARRMK